MFITGTTDRRWTQTIEDINQRHPIPGDAFEVVAGPRRRPAEPLYDPPGHERHRDVAQRPQRQPRRRRAPAAARTRRAPRRDSRGSLPERLLKALAGQVISRVPPADLDERDPDYIRESLPRPVAAVQPVLPRRGPGPGQHPRGGAGAAGGQPLGRQPHARHHGLHARLQRVLRRRAALLPARPQPRALDAGPGLPAQVRHRRRLAGQRREGAALGRGGARLPRRRPRGPPPDLARPPRRLRRPPRLHPPRARARRADRAGRLDRRPGDGALPQPRRDALQAAGPRPAAAPQGAADLDRGAVGHQRRRLPRPRPAAGQDHRRGAAPDPPARRVRPRARRRRGLRARRCASCRRPSTRSPPSAGCR